MIDVILFSGVALARCPKCGQPSTTVRKYPHQHQLAPGHDRVLCALPGCMREADAWLNDEEQSEYRRGQRMFRIRGKEVEVV
jgi:hypothetical protein